MTEQTDVEAEDDGVIGVLSKKTGVSVVFEKSFGDTLPEAVQLFGEDVVFNLFHRQATIACQSRVRGILDKGGSKDAAVEAGLNFKPGVITRTRVAKDPVAELARQVVEGKLTMEQLEEQLKARLAELRPV